MSIDLIKFAGIFENAFKSRAEFAEVRAHDLTESVEWINLFIDSEYTVGKHLAYPFQNTITALLFK